MLSDRLRQTFLLLLRQGLWRRAEDATSLFPLTDGEWTDICLTARKQTVQGIIYDGITMLPAECQPQKELMAQWAAELNMIERVNMQHRMVLEGLKGCYARQPEVKFVLLKGLGMADFYPSPLHRVAGDIDLWFGNEELTEQANQRMESLGLQVKRGGNGESACVVNGVLIEHHSHLIDLHNPFLQRKLRAWEQETFSGSGDTPAPVANHLLLSTHILKHFINEGIGMRQLCDVAMATVALAGKTDAAALRLKSEEWHILRWNQLLYALLVKYFGLPAEYLPVKTNANPDKLMNEVWASGNFGQGDERYGDRPAGKWANKRYTVRRIAHKINLSLGYAANETFWWIGGLCTVRLKELFLKR